MRNFLKAFLVFLIWAFLALYKNCNTNDKSAEITSKDEKINRPKSTTKKKVDTPITKKITPVKVTPIKPPAKKTKEEAGYFTFNHKFITNAQHTKVLFPKDFNYFKDSIFSFLNKNFNKEILIIAYYAPNELLANNSNYGIARANYLKNKLSNYGVNKKRIQIKSIVKDYAYDSEGFYADGIVISYKNLPEKQRVEIEKEITNKTLYANFGNNGFQPDRNLVAYTYEVKNYLKQFPTKKISIVGHTDDLGEEEANYTLGLERAQSVANFFKKNGIDKNKITVSSEGEKKPTVTNNTKANRAINRRIEISIK